MDILSVIKGRKSTRAFLDNPVDNKIIETILDTARWAPSGTNTQPWNVCVVEGETKTQLSNKILAARENKQHENPDYLYYPKVWRDPYKKRRKETGLTMYQALGIGMKDTEKRLTAWNRNYRFFDAPVGLIIMIEDDLEQGSWLDMGMFIQNILLSARAFDLATCPQAAMAEFPDIVRQSLSLPDNMQIVCGIALGYPDKDHPVNQFQLTREPVESFTHWYN